MAFTVEHVKLITPWLSRWIGKGKDKIAKIMLKFPYLGQGKLYEYLTVLKTVVWDLQVERDIPDGCSEKAMHWGKIIILYFIAWRMYQYQYPSYVWSQILCWTLYSIIGVIFWEHFNKTGCLNNT